MADHTNRGHGQHRDHVSDAARVGVRGKGRTIGNPETFVARVGTPESSAGVVSGAKGPPVTAGGDTVVAGRRG
jgi:hypothetical protein